MRRVSVVTITFLALRTLAGEAPLAAPIPIEIIGKLPVFEDPMISPSGDYVASRMMALGHQILVVQRLGGSEVPQENPAVIKVGDSYFSWFDWANDERLILGVRDTADVAGFLLSTQRMASIGRDGKDAVIFPMERNLHGMYRQNASVLSWLKNDADHILAMLDDEPGLWGKPRVHKVNIVTGERTLIEKNRKGYFRWIADYDGDVRIGTRYGHKFGEPHVKIYYRANSDSRWELLQDVDFFAADRFLPYGFQRNDDNILLVSTNEHRGEFDYAEDLYRYDLTQRKITGPYQDEDFIHIQALTKRALPDRETKIVSLSKDRTVGFIRAYSDTSSPEYYLLNLNEGKLDYIAAEYPELVNFELAPMEKRSFVARDGRTIPLFLTMPLDRADSASPAIVMPHGGPWAHDEWGFDNYVQFLASRGYAVLQPQFRGSTGYGREHEEAGYGEWGKSIQDDITDATLWAIESGLIDKDRICILGHSFGGYAAAMGVIKEPELYSCAISINGVMDLERLVRDTDTGLVGDVGKKLVNDYKDTEPYSPYHRADEIKVPILLLGSKRDTVVPIQQHSQKMHQRLLELEKTAEYIELPNGEHWRTNEANELTILRAVESFLARHISSEPAQTQIN